MDYIQVTFIGGPWDMMRRAMSAEEVSRGYYQVLNAPRDSWSLEHATRRGHIELKLDVVTYRLCSVGFDKRGRDIVVGVAE